jgi:hypothetical protein
VSKRAVDALFEGLFILTDIRCMLRDTAPGHALDEHQREQVRSLLSQLEAKLAVIREELVS